MKEIILYFLFRVTFAIFPQSLPYADEMWQGPEIAHKDVFGYGWLTWEWTREQPLRSPLYHFLFTILYSLLKILNLDYPLLIAYSPRILQCIFSSIYDFYLIKLLQLEGIRSKSLIILVNYTIWFSLNCFSKTLINTFETFLFTIALYYWIVYLQKNENKDNLKCRLFVILNVIARQSSIIPWIFIWPFHLLTTKNNLKSKIKILFINIITLLILIICSTFIDSIYHKKLTSTFYNFLEFNLLSGMSSFYGVHQVSWFITQGIPYVCLGWTLFLLIGLYTYVRYKILTKQSLRLIYYAIFTIFILSLSAHKEDRFLLPLFPIFIYFICYGIESLHKQKWQKLKFFIIILSIITNIGFFIFMNTYQDVGALKTMEVLRNRNATDIEFFTQCHRTPFYSFIHKNIQMRFPDCSPNQNITQVQTYQLHHNPLKYIQQELNNHNPSHIVIYNYLENQEVIELFKNYQEINRFYHQYITDTYFGDKYNVEFVIYEKIK